MAYCAGVLGVHAVVYRGVVADVKNVMGISAVVMGMWWWFVLEWFIVAKRRGLDGGNPVESWLGLKHTVSRPAVVEIPAVAVRIETFPRVLVF